jgi:hypothetical protein
VKIFKYLNIFIGIILIITISTVFFPRGDYNFRVILESYDISTLIMSFFIYTFSHVLRAIRLIILTNSDKISLKDVFRK